MSERTTTTSIGDAAPAAPAWRWEEWRLPSGLTGRAALPDEPRYPPLLLLHGLAGGAWYWERWQRFLAERGWPSYALNLRGHHDSRPVPALGKVSLRDYVEDTHEAAAALDRPVVVGHSMGGLLAQALAATDAVSAAVLLCSMPPKGIRFASLPLAWRQLRNLGPLLFERPVVGRVADHEYLSLHRVPAAERAALAGRLVPDSGRVGRELSLGGLAVDRDRVRCPMLSISAEEDRFFPPRVGREISARYHCAWWRYRAHAHFVVMEPGWETIAADAERWLAHMLAVPSRQVAYDRLWRQLQGSIGEERELTFYDGRRVVAEIVNVDLARHQDVIYELRAVRDPGPGGMEQPAVGDTVRAGLYELSAQRSAVSAQGSDER
ncbi:MAG TPA: alpha/beta fold hydrolase [Gemmatimonadaceae bacterium]|nr:alpha/beta fold hydrolase [Gemmatimonadaceae bacterium]